MQISVSTPYFLTSDWIKAIDGVDGYGWRDTPVMVDGNPVSPLFAPSLAYALMARDHAAAVSGAGFSWRLAFSAMTSDADPGAGIIRANSATVAAITALYIDDTGADGTDYTAVMALFDQSTSTVKGQVSLVNIADRSKWFRAEVIGVTRNTGYFTITVRNPAASDATLPFSTDDALTFGFTRTGDAGDAGASLSFAWNIATGGGDPGAGAAAANNANLPDATEIHVSDLDARGVDISAEIISLNAVTQAPKAIIVLRSTSEPSIAHRFNLSSVSDGNGFLTLNVTHLSGTGTLTADAAFYLSYSRSGNAGPAGNIDDLTEQAETTALADDDLLVVHDTSAGGTRKITVSNAKMTFALTAIAVSSDVNPAEILTRYICNTSAAPFTITLPASPADGDRIGIADAGENFATNNLTIARNGNRIAGDASDLMVDLDRATFELIHIGGDWRII